MAYSEKDEEEENFEALCDGYEARIAAQKEEIQRLRDALDLIANTGMDARQCMLTARNALKST